MLVVGGVGEAAQSDAAPYPVAIASNHAIQRVPQGPGYPGRSPGERTPQAAEGEQAAKHGLALVEELLAGRTARLKDENGLRSGGPPVLQEQGIDGGVVLGGKAEAAVAVQAQEPSHDRVTKPAVAVIDDQQPAVEFLCQIQGFSRIYGIRRVVPAMHNPA